MPPHEAQEARDLVAIWKAERLRYPGWVVLPEDLRLSLWLRTSHWVGKVPAPDALPAGLDLEFAFELTWRSTRCLSPIFDNQVPFLEATIDRYWPATGSSTLIGERVRVVVSGGRVRVDHGPDVVAEHIEHTGRHTRITERAHLVGINRGPRPASAETDRPKPELLRPLDAYAAVAGGSF